MKRNSDVIVIGGGVIGLTTAYFLAREGAQVIVCEQGKTGMESSWAGAGILPPSDLVHAQNPLDRLRAISGQLFPSFSQELRERTGIDNGFFSCGGIEFVSQMHDAVDPQEWYGLGVSTSNLTEAQAQQLEPALAPHLGAAIHIPGLAQLRNPRHMQALRAACLDTKKVVILENAPIRRLEMSAGRVKEVRTNNEELSGASYLLATGVWIDTLLEPLGIRLNVQPVRGQIALLNPGTMLFHHVLIWGTRYLVPRADGLVLIGSTEEHAGYAKNTTAEGIAGLLALALKIVPGLAGANVERTWAGLRPGSPDGVPYIGPVPHVENLFVAAGHFRAGIQLSPGTALLLKERLLGQPASMPLDAFRLDR
jgi:glycine oxidase